MKKKRLLIKLKKLVKIFVLYTIENDYKIYRIRNTKINIRFSLQKRYQSKWGYIPIQKIRLFLIIIWEWDMDVIVSTLQSDY